VYGGKPRPQALELPFIKILAEQDANLRWPGASLHLDLVGAAPTVDPLIGDTAPLLAAGEEYVIAHVGAQPSGAPIRDISDAVIKVAGKPVPVPKFGRDTFIVVPAKKEAIVRLEITDTDRMQWIDLRTAETGNLIDGYYPRRRDGSSLACDITSPTKAIDESTVVLMAGATLEPWSETRGWAPKGRLWLVLEMKIWYSRNGITVSLDGATTVKLTGPQGPLPVSGTMTLSADGRVAVPLLVTADVPADLTVVQLAVDLHGTFTAAAGVVPAWKATCETQQDALSFQP